MDAPQVVYNLTVELVATYVVGAGQWVVHNVVCPIYPATDEQFQIDAYRETGWVLSNEAIFRYRDAIDNGLSRPSALQEAINGAWVVHDQFINMAGGLMNAAAAHGGSGSRTFISFTVNQDVLPIYGTKSIITIDQVEINNIASWIIDNRMNGIPTDEEILVSVAIPWSGFGSMR